MHSKYQLLVAVIDEIHAAAMVKESLVPSGLKASQLPEVC